MENIVSQFPKKNNMKIQKNNYESMIIKIIMAMLIIAILALAGLTDYNQKLDSSNKETTNINTTVNSIKKLNVLINSYLITQNEKIKPGRNISISSIMQQENFIPNSWAVKNNKLIPLNKNFVSSYKLITDSDFIKPVYMITIKAPKMTNKEALAICNSLKYITYGVSSNNNPSLNLIHSKSCLKALFNNKTSLINNSLFKKNLTFTFIIN